MLKRTYKRARQEEAAGAPPFHGEVALAAPPQPSPPPPPLLPLPSPPSAAAPPPTGFSAWRAPFASCPFPRARDVNAALPATAPPAPPPAPSGSGAACASASAAPASPGAPRRTIQLHLDLGQRAFDSTRCLRCGMVYCPGDAGDERLHAAQCAREAGEGEGGAGCSGGGSGGSGGGGGGACSALQWPAHARDDVVATGEGGVRIIRVPPVAAAAASSGGGGAGVPPALQARAAAVAAHLLAVLGPHSLPSSGDDCSSDACGGSAPLLLHYYVAVGAGSGAVLGALCAHVLPTPTARLVTSSAGSEGADSSSSSSSSAEAPAPVPAPLLLRRDAPRVRAVLGVDQVWVARSGRRRGVARALLDAARAHAVHAHTVPRAEVAFSQPTGEGFALAGAYRGTPGAVPVFFGQGEEE
jgi:hypothetical protein